MFVFIAVVICVITGILSYMLHEQKGYEGGFWVGFFLGILGLIYSAGRPDISSKVAQSSEDSTFVDDIDEQQEQFSNWPNCG